MRLTTRCKLALTLTMLGITPYTNAGDKLTIHGFGTAGVAKSDSPVQYDLLSGRALDDHWNFDTTNTAGIQFDYQVNSKAKFTTQLLARGWQGYSVETEWAYFSYAQSPFLTFRGGRLRFPAYMLSEYLDVGFAYAWVIPPTEVYGMVPTSNYDGFDTLYVQSLGSAILTLHPFIGSHYHKTTADAGETRTDKIIGAEAYLTVQDWNFRISYLTLNQTSKDFPPLAVPGNINSKIVAAQSALPAFLQSRFAPYVASSMPDLSIKDDKYSFGGIGVSRDSGAWLFLSEIVHAKLDNALPDRTAGYISLGYHIGKFTPNITFAGVKSTDDKDRIILAQDGVSNSLAGRLLGLEFNTHQQSVTLGVRWDFTPGFALKADWERVSHFSGTYGMFDSRTGMDTSSLSGLSGLQYASLAQNLEKQFGFKEDRVNFFRLAISGAF